MSRAYECLLRALAVVAAAILGLSALLITFDVLLRAMGWQPPAHTVSLTEYGLLYATLLGAPWLLRRHGHVHVEVVVMVLPEHLRRLAEALVCLICCAACLVVVWAAGNAMFDNLARGSFDMRSFDMPKWLLYAPFPLSFVMMAGEFLRFLLGRESLYAEAPEGEGRV
ncbi:MAG: TRAP transporter small permease [Alphaproteobacteria bacterium]|jgi:TRAP-type C4-dicarboxylate transport system permease small subunit|nr:TRAP transporter small permease [Alphaproteobacteria bacterium]MDP6237237.1 TRAP transporter small permease [Alphaproteobacteria bacterium]MDP7173825.1 TRAP transporter small permease [Alphaproteobacteria bacterium]MDP7233921.1 TRAP transporter small permease [Alphaproteobacteria bacterium]MDP7488838.1 TRAP transporter small permease [Alphaproteobacteria bacterium]|tara:strand:+ start:1249 stop:1752 length:504 start_codon:yes stop_codon:yes gene_type:complete